MARAVWSGVLHFGLVTVPVQLYSATGDHTIHFRQLQRGTSDRVRYRRVNERTGEEVPYDEVVRGYEINGEYVVIEPDELDNIAPGRSRAITIEAFVDLNDIDPVYFQQTYWLAPSRNESGHAYSLLFEALSRTNRAGIARLVMRGREHITAIRAGTDALALTTLLFSEDIRDPKTEISNLPDPGQARTGEVNMAVSLIESMTDRWRPEDYHDTYTERVLQLIADKHSGRAVVPEEQPPEATKVVDLLETLSRSVENRRGQKAPRTAGTRPETEQSPRDGADPSTLSKTELEETARELRIEGRSKMNRAELEQAIVDRRRETGHPRVS